jgi:hypothetical protein
MTQEHPITPSPELVKQWVAEIWHEGTPVRVSLSDEHIATRAAQWGADQELEACCEWIGSEGLAGYTSRELRAARRPKPKSQAEEALETLHSMRIDPVVIKGINVNANVMTKYDIIRAALERLRELEGSNDKHLPPSLKEQALSQLGVITKELAKYGPLFDMSQIRRALEQLPDNE